MDRLSVAELGILFNTPVEDPHGYKFDDPYAKCTWNGFSWIGQDQTGLDMDGHWTRPQDIDVWIWKILDGTQKSLNDYFSQFF